MNGKKNLYVLAAMLFVPLLATPAVSAAEDDETTTDGEAQQADDNTNTVAAAKWSAKGYIAIGAGLAVGLAGIGTGLAQSNIGSAAIGAVAEDDKNFTRGSIHPT